jgi:hypothetical protein
VLVEPGDVLVAWKDSSMPSGARDADQFGQRDRAGRVAAVVGQLTVLRGGGGSAVSGARARRRDAE